MSVFAVFLRGMKWYSWNLGCRTFWPSQHNLSPFWVCFPETFYIMKLIMIDLDQQMKAGLRLSEKVAQDILFRQPWATLEMYCPWLSEQDFQVDSLMCLEILTIAFGASNDILKGSKWPGPTRSPSVTASEAWSSNCVFLPLLLFLGDHWTGNWLVSICGASGWIPLTDHLSEKVTRVRTRGATVASIIHVPVLYLQAAVKEGSQDGNWLAKSHGMRTGGKYLVYLYFSAELCWKVWDHLMGKALLAIWRG